MAENERRRGPRVPVQLWVEELSPEGVYYQHTANLSVGGLFLEHTIPHPVGTVVTLSFALPDGGDKVAVRAEIVNAVIDDATFGMGLRFLDLGDANTERIRKFVVAQGAG